MVLGEDSFSKSPFCPNRGDLLIDSCQEQIIGEQLIIKPGQVLSGNPHIAGHSPEAHQVALSGIFDIHFTPPATDTMLLASIPARK